jgi:hypothetical protein
VDREPLPADPTALMARRRAAVQDRQRTAANRWNRFQAASKRRYAGRARRLPPLRLVRLLARAKWPGRVLLLALSGVWHGWLQDGLGPAPGAVVRLVDYVRAGPDAERRPRALFDQASYIAGVPALAGTAWAPLAHYLVLGDREGASPHPLFDVAAYRAQVGAPLGRPTALQHFLFHGAGAGLNPHPLFDVRFYVGQSEEVAASGENPLMHYLRKGWREGLEPHPLFAGAWYLAQQPEAARAGVAPLLHYVTDGARQGFAPHPLFDVAWWRAQTGRAGTGEPIADFLRAGAAERLSPTRHFDPAYYVLQLGGSPEVQANPLLHYLSVGSFDGAWPAEDFDETAYFAAHPEAADSGLTALDHWVRHGTARPEACAAASVLWAPEALAATMRAASTPDPHAYDWAAYEAMAAARGRILSQIDAKPTGPAAPLTDSGDLQVVTLAPGQMDAARRSVAASTAAAILLVEPGVAGVDGWAAALRAALDASAGAVVPAIRDANGGPSGPACIGADGVLRPATSGEGRPVEAASGALVISRELLLEIGALDPEATTAEAQFADLSLRLQSHGRRLLAGPAGPLVRSGAPARWPASDLARDRQRLFERWTTEIEALNRVRVIALRVAAPVDWDAVASAQPNWRGHLQPRLPAEAASADASTSDTLRRQAELAARYGIAGFCHEVADAEAAAGRWGPEAPAFPFCLAWTGQDAPDIAAAALRAGLASPHAIRVGGRVLLLLEAGADTSAWRGAALRLGLGELYLVRRGGDPDRDPQEQGFDAGLTMAPTGEARMRQTGPGFNPRFDGEIYDYRRLVQGAFETLTPGWPSLPVVRPGYDATPTTPDTPVIFDNASPGAFQAWLEWALDHARIHAEPGQGLVLVDAWNDWMHGAALEPDRRLGHGWLEAVANALDRELLER